MTEEATGQFATPIPDSKADLFASIQQAWQTLQTTVAGASQADLLRVGPEGWSPKDHLAHLATWLEILKNHHIDGRPFGEATGVDLSTLSNPFTTDDLNVIFFEHNKNMSLSQVRMWLEQIHADTLDRLHVMSFTDLMQSHDPEDPEARPLILEVMGNTYEHYQQHNRMIRALLDSRS